MAEDIGQGWGEQEERVLQAWQGCRTWGLQGEPGASQHVTSPQPTPREHNAPEPVCWGPTGVTGLGPEYRGEDSGRSCHGCPSTATGMDKEDTCEALPGCIDSLVLAIHPLLQGQVAVPHSPRVELAPPLQWSQTTLQLSEHRSKEVESGCPLGPKASKPSEQRRAHHPHGAPCSLRGCPTLP